MSHIKADRVQETSTGTGTGALTLAGAVSKFRAYSALLANADTCVCLIENASAAEWEVSLCTYASGGNTLTRSTVYASSNAGALVNFAAGTKTISHVAAASKQVVMDNNGDATVTRDLAVARNATVAGTLGVTGATTLGTTGASGKVTLTGAEGFQLDFAPGSQTWSWRAAVGGNMYLYDLTNSKYPISITPSTQQVTFGGKISMIGTEGNQLEWTLGGQAWQARMASGGAWYLIDTTNSVYPFSIAASTMVATFGGNILPAVDNSKSLGNGSYRFSVVYAGTGAINTSGRDAKRNIRELSAAEKRVAARIRAGGFLYQFADAVEAKGEALARLHFGVIAEDVAAAFTAEGLNPARYGMFCADKVVVLETYQVIKTRDRMEDFEAEESAVEIVDGRPVRVTKTVTRRRAVGAMLVVKTETGETVMVETGERDESDQPILVPLTHFVPEMEEYEEEATREVETDEIRYGLRYDQLTLFLLLAAE